MHDSEFTDLPDESELIYQKLPKQAREMGAFIYLVMDAATGDFPNESVQTDIRCFKKGCHGLIYTRLDFENDEIIWHCDKCVTGGNIKIRKNKSWEFAKYIPFWI